MGEGPDARAEGVDVARREGAADEPAEPAVLRRVRVEHDEAPPIGEGSAGDADAFEQAGADGPA